MRIPIESGCARLRPNTDEPHSPQNHFSPPTSGFHTRKLSSPATIRNVPSRRMCARRRPGAAATLAARAVAVARDRDRCSDLEPDGAAVAAAGEWESGRAPHRLEPCVVEERRKLGAIVREQLARGLGAGARGDQLGEVGESAHQTDTRHDLKRRGVRRIERQACRRPTAGRRGRAAPAAPRGQPARSLRSLAGRQPRPCGRTTRPPGGSHGRSAQRSADAGSVRPKPAAPGCARRRSGISVAGSAAAAPRPTAPPPRPRRAARDRQGTAADQASAHRAHARSAATPGCARPSSLSAGTVPLRKPASRRWIR